MLYSGYTACVGWLHDGYTYEAHLLSVVLDHEARLQHVHHVVVLEELRRKDRVDVLVQKCASPGAVHKSAE